MTGYHFFAVSADREAGGIYDVWLAPEKGGLSSRLRTLCPNLNYVIRDPLRNMFYGTVSQMPEDAASGGLAVFDSSARLLRVISAGGANSCHLALSPDGKFLYTAQYGDGTVSEFPLDEAGDPGAPRVFRHSGSGPVLPRQAGPHSHFTGFTPEGDALMNVDLGLDAVFLYPWKAGEGITDTPEMVKVPAGEGPRHLIFTPDHGRFFVANELGSTVTAFAWQGGTARMLATVPTVLQKPVVPNWPGAIRLSPDGQYLLISNRGDDSIALFGIGDGDISLIRATGSGGHWPRDFVFTPQGDFVIVANERSGNLASFRYQPENGGLIPCGRVTEIPAVLNCLFL